MTLTTTLTDRAASFLQQRTGRRSFLAKSAIVGSAITATGTDFVLRPGTAYAAVCSCLGRSCNCTDLCCDGYTEFCCQVYGGNSCPPNTIIAGWWKVDNSNYCAGAARYYMDCNKTSPACGCGSSGVCRGGDTTCQCRSCGNRKDGCTAFRYGNCNNHVACVGPIMCRVVTCTPPWQIDPGCSTVSRTDNNTRYHHRPCLDPEPTAAQLAFVEKLYRDFLGRPSDATGRDYWGGEIARGVARDTMAKSFAFSVEYTTTVVIGLYRLALDRNPDRNGREFWVDQLRCCRTTRDVAAELFASQEFWDKSGRDPARFVRRLFSKVLGRPASSSDVSYWVGQMNQGASRKTVALSIYQSLESRRRRVTSLYRRFLRRSPDTSGRDYWADVIATSEDISVALYIAAGPEYYTLAGRLYG